MISPIRTTFKSVARHRVIDEYGLRLPLSDPRFKPQFQAKMVYNLTNTDRYLLLNTDPDFNGVTLPFQRPALRNLVLDILYTDPDGLGHKHANELSHDGALDAAYVLSGTAYYAALQEFATGYYESETFSEARYRLHYNNIAERLHDIRMQRGPDNDMINNILQSIPLRGTTLKRTVL